MQVLYTADVTAEGARHGHVRSSDGLLDFDLALPPGMGGKGDKTNPEQLFGAGYAACFGGAVEYQAMLAKKKIGVVTVRAHVSVGPFDEGQGEGFTLRVELDVTIPEVDQATAEELVAAAHRGCPYSNATRGNIEVKLTAHGGR
ncbi:MAG TPA: organic hydroperoxide resistance protein [Acidobacteriaceae bacterium]|jgi:osmotically inducible protein OsmC|nr:organic hydroperoxide resistance protein [Acidobacteriaceae bacterium]